MPFYGYLIYLFKAFVLEKSPIQFVLISSSKTFSINVITIKKQINIFFKFILYKQNCIR